MTKISGRITNTPPPLPKDGNIYTMEVKIGTPIEGVKVSDGEKVVFSDKNGQYEIETAKRNVEFSKEDYASETIDLNTFTEGSTTKKNIVLQSYGVNKNASDNKTIMGFRQSTFFIAIGIAVVGLGWWYFKSRKKAD